MSLGLACWSISISDPQLTFVSYRNLPSYRPFTFIEFGEAELCDAGWGTSLNGNSFLSMLRIIIDVGCSVILSALVSFHYSSDNI